MGTDIWTFGFQFPVGGAVWGALGDVAFLGEIFPWWRRFQRLYHSQLAPSSSCLKFKMWALSFLEAPCHFATVTDSHLSGLRSPNKILPSTSCLGQGALSQPQKETKTPSKFSLRRVWDFCLSPWWWWRSWSHDHIWETQRNGALSSVS